jgi:hypothetical protein
VNVDTGEFQALTERVAEIEECLRLMDTTAEILRRAGMSEDMRAVAERQAQREARQLKPVK